MAQAANYFAWQSRLVAPELGQRVIEVGCGIGNFTGTLLDREAVLAVDVDPACIERLRERYSESAEPAHLRLRAVKRRVRRPGAPAPGLVRLPERVGTYRGR